MSSFLEYFSGNVFHFSLRAKTIASHSFVFTESTMCKVLLPNLGEIWTIQETKSCNKVLLIVHASDTEINLKKLNHVHFVSLMLLDEYFFCIICYTIVLLFVVSITYIKLIKYENVFCLYWFLPIINICSYPVIGTIILFNFLRITLLLFIFYLSVESDLSGSWNGFHNVQNVIFSVVVIPSLLLSLFVYNDQAAKK